MEPDYYPNKNLKCAEASYNASVLVFLFLMKTHTANLSLCFRHPLPTEINTSVKQRKRFAHVLDIVIGLPVRLYHFFYLVN